MSKKANQKQASKPGKRSGVFAAVTETLIEMIEGGRLPWRSNWSSVRPSKGHSRKPRLVLIGRLLLPTSVSSDKPYRGVNVLILWAAALKKGYGSPFWGSLNAWNGVGCKVRKGEQATRIVRWVEQTEVDPASGDVVNEEWFPVIHSIFNVAQVEGPSEILTRFRADEPAPKWLPEPATETETDSEPPSWDWEPAEGLVSALNPKLKWGGNRACYNTRSDMIHMPDRDRFHTQAGLYAVLMHEIGHWTGSRKRLNRDLSGGEGTPSYWFEELVAELTACFVLAALDLPERLEELPNSAAYLQHYLDLIKDDRRSLFRAASLAQKASDYISTPRTGDAGGLSPLQP